MKRLTILIVAFVSFALQDGISQHTPGFKYQAVARSAQGEIMKDADLGVRLRVIDDVSTVYFEETYSVTTSDLGIFSLNVGHGNAVMGDLASIPWNDIDVLLEVSIDPDGGNNYEVIGSSAILGVPYSFYSIKSGSSENDLDKDPTNELQSISLEDNILSISEGNSVSLEEYSDGDGDSSNELQMLSKAGNIITLSNGGGDVTDEVDDLDADPTNELQMISKAGNIITLSNGGGDVTDEVDDLDADPENEIQFLDLQGTTLSISEGNSVQLAELADGDGDPTNELQMLSKTGNIITLSNGGGDVIDEVDDLDADPENEIQSLDLQGTTLSISEGNSVELDEFVDDDGDPTNELQDLSLEGTMLEISNGSGINLPVYWEFEEGDPIENIPDRIDADYIAKVPGLWVEGGTTIYSDGISTTDNIETHGNGVRFEMYSNTAGKGINQGIGSDDYGFTQWFGANGNANVQVYRQGNSNHGKISVYDAAGNIQTAMYVNGSGQGVISADIKNFRMDHPIHEDKEIVYASLEGPEAAAYVRGHVILNQGEAYVEFPEHFSQVINPEGMTILLTAHSADSKGLAAIQRTVEGFVIKELLNGKGNYMVDWEAKSVRKGFENYQVIRSKAEEK